MVGGGRMLALLGAAVLLAVPLTASAAPSALAAATGPAPAPAVLDAAPGAPGTACGQAAPCSLSTALAEASAAGGDVTIDLAAGTYTASAGYVLILGAPGSSVSLVGAPGGSVLDGAGSAPVLSLAGPGSVSVTGLTFTSGSTQGNGGGIADAGGPALSVVGSTFVDDQAAGSGGAVAVSGGTPLSVVGSTFVGDVAGVSGGAIVAGGAPAVVVGSTLVSGSAPSGGGVAGDASTTLEADVLAVDAGGACAGPVVDAGYVVADDTTCPAGTGSQVVADAALFPGGVPAPASLGGPAQVVPIAVVSDPAMDAVPAAATLPGSSVTFCSTADERQVPRLQPVPSGKVLAKGCSPGAFQAALPVIVRLTPPSAGPGSLVTVTGRGLGLVTGVALGGTAVPFSASGDTSLAFVVPPGTPPGETPVSLTSPDTSLLPGGPATASLSVAGPLAVQTASLPYTETGAVIFDRLVAAGGAGGDRWAATGPLPEGLHVSPNGFLSGFPQTPGSFPVAVAVTDRSGVVARATFTLVIGTGPSVETSSLPVGQVGSRYVARLAATGGRPPYRWTVPSSTKPFPGGLLLSSRGVLMGLPGTAGTTDVTLLVTDAAGGRATVTLPVQVLPPPPPPQAYVVASADGHVTAYGEPSLPARAARAPGRVVAVAMPPRGGGYWQLTSTGAVLGNGSVHSLGSVGRSYLRGRPVGIAPTPGGNGYWVVSSAGRVYGFGTAHALGTARQRRLAARRLGRVVGIAASPVGTGYWLVGATGRVVAFGDATPYGSIGARRRVHVVAIAASPQGTGYLLVSSAGRVYGFGSDRVLGFATHPRAGRFVGIAAAPQGVGYWLVTTRGLVEAEGSARALSPPFTTVPTGAVAIASAP